MEVDSRLCLRNRLNSCRCSLCIDDCPANALNYSDKRIQLDQSKCTECMLCTSACPNDAFTPGYDFGGELIAFEQSKDEVVNFSCPRQKDFSAGEKVVPCLGIFSYEALLFLGSSSKKRAVYFNAVSCSFCTNMAASLAFRRMLERLRRQAGSILCTDLIIRDGYANDGRATDRRSFLGVLKKGAFAAAKSSLPAHPPQSNDSHDTRRIPLKTKLLQKSLQNLADDVPPSLAAAFSPDLSINAACVPCPRCSGICPTGALKLSGAAKQKILIFRPERCSSCGLCIAFCKHNALSLSSPYQPPADSLDS